MTDLPPGWEQTILGEILLRIEAGKSFSCEPRQATADEWGIIKVSAMTWGSFREKENKAVPSGTTFDPAYEIKPGDILVSRANTQEYVGAPVLVGPCRPRLLLSDKSLRLVPSPHIDRRWLALLLSSPLMRGEISRRATGTKDSMRNISQSSLRDIRVWVPSLTEQQRIVAILEDHCSRLSSGMAQLQKILLRIDSMRERVMAAACTGGLDVEPDDLFAPAPVAVEAVDGELPALPSSWRWTRLGELAEVVGGITKDSKKQSDPSIPLIPYLRVANVQRGRLELSEIAHIRVSDDKAEKLMLRRGDVLLNEGGDRDKLGRGWIWEGQIDRCIHQNHVFRARIHGDVLHPKLLAWHANGVGRKWFEVNGKQSVNLASISLSKIKMFPVPVPPRALQENLVSATETRLSILDRSEALIREALAWASSLRRSLLTEAFAGRLVQQDPADEPASELMKRIEAERAAQPKAGRGRRTKTVEAPVAGRTEWPDAGRTPVSYEQEELL